MMPNQRQRLICGRLAVLFMRYSLFLPRLHRLTPLQVLSGKVPFYQIRLVTKVASAITAGKKPTRPNPQGNGVEEVADAIWSPVSTCWEFETKDRPSCIQFQDAFSSRVIQDDRPTPKPPIQPGTFEESSSLHLDRARSTLMRIVGSGLSMPPPSRIPEHFQKPLFGLADNGVKAEAVAVAAKKLSPDNTQILVDVLDLVSIFLSLSS
jgi:hypothetical protein